jgi:hypothetical protein
MGQAMPKSKHFDGPDEKRPFAHMFFFQLCNSSTELVDRFVELCVKYLSGHRGQEHFSVGVRALGIHRDVSATNFEVSVHMIFENIAAFQAYSNTQKHEDFITQSAGMSPVRIVYDSYLRFSVPPHEPKPKEDK